MYIIHIYHQYIYHKYNNIHMLVLQKAKEIDSKIFWKKIVHVFSAKNMFFHEAGTTNKTAS